jgi:DNA-binding MarR family transcriptional regulator
MSRQNMRADAIDERQAQWARELPDVDTIGMAILGRARWITLNARRPIEAVFAAQGIDTGEFDVLATLLRAGPPYRLRPTELFKSLMVSSGGMTDRLNRLQKAGLIARISAEMDGRSLLVELTAEGRAVAQRAFREDMAVEEDLLATLSDAEREMLARLLRKLVLAFEATDEAQRRIAFDSRPNGMAKRGPAAR